MRFRPFPYTVPVFVPGSDEQSVQLANGKRLHMLNWAIDYIDKKIKNHKPCNDCFRKLPGGKTLREIWDSNSVWVSYFDPKSHDRVGETRVPFDIAVAEDAFKDGKMLVVATIIHELGHIGGAPGQGIGKTLPNGLPNNQAEAMLKCCLLADMFDPNAYGAIDRVLGRPDAPQNAVA
jgi:hypothetical protein